MKKLLSENKLLNTRRGLLKGAGLGALALLGLSKGTASTQDRFEKEINIMPDDKLFGIVREELMLKQDLVYLNTGTLGPAPKLVFNKVSQLTKRLEANPAIENFGPMGREMEKTRLKVAAFMGANEEEIILTRNTTEGISLVCSSISWAAGDEILTTNHEHGGADTGIEFLASTKGALIKRITMPYPADSKEELLELVRANLTSKTKMILLSHVETVTGLRWPIKEVSELIRGRDILFIVDGAQAPGMFHIDLQDLGCDVYACSGHKWIMGPKETGILYLRQGIQDRVNNVFIAGGYDVYSASSGTRNAPIIIGFGDVIDWHMALGTSRIERHCMKLAKYCYSELKKIKSIKIISPNDPDLSSAIVSFSLPKSVKNNEVFTGMRDKGITIKRLPQYNAIRISNHMFNTNQDVDKMIKMLKNYLS